MFLKLAAKWRSKPLARPVTSVTPFHSRPIRRTASRVVHRRSQYQQPEQHEDADEHIQEGLAHVLPINFGGASDFTAQERSAATDVGEMRLDRRIAEFIIRWHGRAATPLAVKLVWIATLVSLARLWVLVFVS